MAFSRLSESIKKTIAVADGYKLGRLVFENEDSRGMAIIRRV